MKQLKEYRQDLEHKELSKSTITKYVTDVKQLELFLQDKELNKKNLIAYKKHLIKQYTTNTVNNKIVTANKFLDFIGKGNLKLKQITTQRKTELDEVLSETDYSRLLRQAKQKGNPRDVLILEIIYNTGIRVSEIKDVTVKALKKGYILADNKGKIRKVPINTRLKKQLTKYVRDNDIKAGSIILNNQGKPLGRTYIFKRLKYLGGQARIKKSKVYPHSIRHLFAKNWIKANGDNILQLADILGHSSLETTRIYTQLNTDEARETMEF